MSLFVSALAALVPAAALAESPLAIEGVFVRPDGRTALVFARYAGLAGSTSCVPMVLDLERHAWTRAKAWPSALAGFWVGDRWTGAWRASVLDSDTTDDWGCLDPDTLAIVAPGPDFANGCGVAGGTLLFRRSPKPLHRVSFCPDGQPPVPVEVRESPDDDFYGRPESLGVLAGTSDHDAPQRAWLFQPAERRIVCVTGPAPDAFATAVSDDGKFVLWKAYERTETSERRFRLLRRGVDGRGEQDLGTYTNDAFASAWLAGPAADPVVVRTASVQVFRDGKPLAPLAFAPDAPGRTEPIPWRDSGWRGWFTNADRAHVVLYSLAERAVTLVPLRREFGPQAHLVGDRLYFGQGARVMRRDLVRGTVEPVSP